MKLFEIIRPEMMGSEGRAGWYHVPTKKNMELDWHNMSHTLSIVLHPERFGVRPEDIEGYPQRNPEETHQEYLSRLEVFADRVEGQGVTSIELPAHKNGWVRWLIVPDQMMMTGYTYEDVLGFATSPHMPRIVKTYHSLNEQIDFGADFSAMGYTGVYVSVHGTLSQFISELKQHIAGPSDDPDADELPIPPRSSFF